MNRSVPTLLGIMIILMVAVLVILVYDYRLTSGLAAGHVVVGTVGGQILTQVEQPTEQISPSEVFEKRVSKANRLNAREMQRRQGRLAQRMTWQERGARREARRGLASALREGGSAGRQGNRTAPASRERGSGTGSP